MTAAKALKSYMDALNDHEKGEILDYKNIYTIGLGAEKIKASILKQPNYGYDDDKGDYQVVEEDHFAYRY